MATFFKFQDFSEQLIRGIHDFDAHTFKVYLTNPAMREMFMYPRNVWRVKEALLSLLAGDIFGSTPIWTRLALFKSIYRINALSSWRRSAAARKKRRLYLRDVGTVKDENVLSPPTQAPHSR